MLLFAGMIHESKSRLPIVQIRRRVPAADGSFRPRNHPGGMIFGPDGARGDPGPRAQWEELYRRGDLIGQLSQFLANPGLQDRDRRSLRIPNGLEITILFHRITHAHKIPFLEVRNVGGIDFAMLDSHGQTLDVRGRLDPWISFINAVTHPDFEGGDRYQGVRISGEGNSRISRWCVDEGWEPVPPLDNAKRGFKGLTDFPDEFPNDYFMPVQRAA